MRTTKSISVCLTYDTLKTLDKLAQNNHLSRSAQITQLVWNSKEVDIHADKNKRQANINRADAY